MGKKICRDWKQGRACIHGSNCKFMHPDQTKRRGGRPEPTSRGTTVCRDWQAGDKCALGSKCPFRHGSRMRKNRNNKAKADQNSRRGGKKEFGRGGNRQRGGRGQGRLYDNDERRYDGDDRVDDANLQFSNPAVLVVLEKLRQQGLIPAEHNNRRQNNLNNESRDPSRTDIQL